MLKYNYNTYNFLLTPCRFDLMAKYLYVKYLDKNINSNFHVDMYEKHIKTFNNCWEHPGTKTNIKEFFEAFNSLIRDIKINNFNPSHPIPIGKNNIIINGAHRLVTSFYYKKTIYYSIKNVNGCESYNSNFFMNRKKFPSLPQIYSDTMALEYIKLNPNIRIMCIHPVAYDLNKINKIKKIISRYGYLYYEKIVNLNENGFNNLIKEMYRGEKWIGGMFPRGKGKKTELCFSNNPTVCFLIHMNDLTKLVELKEKCRALYTLNKHSLHISDYTKDTFRIASSLLNNNSIHFLNNGTNDISEQTKKLLNRYFDTVKTNDEDFCLTSSLILELYGIRRAKDIDYLHKDNLSLSLEKTGLHSGKWLEYYNTNKDEIIYNPKNYFYVNGYKLASLQVIIKMKENRNEPKDVNDLKLIKSKRLKT